MECLYKRETFQFVSAYINYGWINMKEKHAIDKKENRHYNVVLRESACYTSIPYDRLKNQIASTAYMYKVCFHEYISMMNEWIFSMFSWIHYGISNIIIFFYVSVDILNNFYSFKIVTFIRFILFATLLFINNRYLR